MRWQHGFLKGPMQLMAELSGLSIAQLGLVTYPDASALLDEFFLHIPAVIRSDVAASKESPIGTPPTEAEGPPAAAPGAHEEAFNPENWEGAPDRGLLG